MIKKVAMVAISAIIGVLLVVTVLTPILMGATSETLTTRNTGSFFAAVSDDDTEHTIIISAGTGSFVIKTDGKTDITPSMGTYNPGGEYVSKAIAIGVYNGYIDNGVMTSQANKTPVTETLHDDLRTATLAGNRDNTIGTYQMMNTYQNSMFTMMVSTILGTVESKDFMGAGTIATGTTGSLSAPYVKSANSGDPLSILVENPWGYLYNMLGDSYYNSKMYVDNTLGGHAFGGSISGETITVPTQNAQYITSVYTDQFFGMPKTSSATETDSPYNGAFLNTGAAAINRPISVGGLNNLLSINYREGYNISDSVLQRITSRMTYVMTDYQPTTTNYGYVMTFTGDLTSITSVQALVNGELTTDGMTTGTTIGDFWQFNTTTGIGPFGAYYVAINLADVDTESDTDYLAETMLGTKKGQVAYILNPSDWTETLAGTTYTSGNYNVMLVIPTVYWGVIGSKLYMSNDPATFANVEGLELQPYAHTYTVDPSVDTGNPVTTASATVVYGEDYIVRLYSTGDVYLITTNAMTYLGQASGDNTVELTVTGDVLGYTPSGGSATTIDDVLAYIASTGEYVQCKNPMYSTSQEGAQFIIGGYANNLTTTTDDVVDIGYCLTVDAADLSLSTITVLNPVSDASNTVDTNGAVWGESTLIKSDLYKVGDLTITTTWSDTGKSVATYNYYLAPEKVTYTNPNYINNGPVESILNVLPIIIVAGLLLGILSMIVVGKLKE